MPLFRSVIGASFDGLPAPIRAIHDGSPLRRCEGASRVERGGRWLSRLFGAVTSLPAATDEVPLSVTIRADGDGETWERDFGGHMMRSRLRLRDGLLEESLGPASFRFRLVAEGGAIDWRLTRVRCLGIALPLSWFGPLTARESLERGRYRFDVRVELPMTGLLVRYDGTLDVGA